MRRLMLSMVLAIGVAGPPAAAQDGAIEGTIRSQIDAFLEDDFDRAFSYASPMIQGIFRTPENFGVMVRKGYPMVWRPLVVRFLDLSETDGRIVQRVQLVDQDGVTYVAEYEMIETEDGWQINGVRIERAPEVGA